MPSFSSSNFIFAKSTYKILNFLPRFVVFILWYYYYRYCYYIECMVHDIIMDFFLSNFNMKIKKKGRKWFDWILLKQFQQRKWISSGKILGFRVKDDWLILMHFIFHLKNKMNKLECFFNIFLFLESYLPFLLHLKNSSENQIILQFSFSYCSFISLGFIQWKGWIHIFYSWKNIVFRLCLFCGVLFINKVRIFIKFYVENMLCLNFFN